MNVLILNRQPLAACPYHEWLDGTPGANVLLTSAASLREHHESLDPLARHYAESRAYEDYDRNGTLELDAIALHERHRFGAVFALGEYDLIRAARLREHFGLPGQAVASARVFHDRVAMKDRARQHGIAVAAYRAVTNALDLLDFVGAHGYPVIVKPRSGLAAFTTRVLAGDPDVEAVLATGLVPSFEVDPDVIVEEFVEGTGYHVDGLVLEGEVVQSWPSRYTAGTTDGGGDAATPGSVPCDPQAALTQRLRQFAHAVLRAFPTPATTAFRAEIVHTPADRLLLGEVASRIDASANAYVARVFGVDVARTWLRSLAAE